MPGKELVPRPAVQPPAVQGMPPWARDKRETVTAWTWLYRRRHWTLPAVLLLLLPAVAELLRLTGTAGYAVLACCVLCLVIICFGRLKWDRPAEHVYAAVSAAFLALWLLAATGYGLAHTAWLGVPWVLVSLGAGVMTWGVFWWLHKRPRGMRKRAKKIARWDEWWQSHCWHWNLGGSKVADVWEMGVTTKVRVHGVAGRHTKQHVDQVMHLIESGLEGLGVDAGMVRAETVKGHPAWFDFYFKRDNPLAQVVEYDHALAPRSVHEQYVAGKTETGAWRMEPLRISSFVIGTTRSGKSNHLLVRFAALSGCADSVRLLIDLKGGRCARPVLAAGAADCVVTEVPEAVTLLRMLVAEIRARAKYAYVDDEEQLRATVEIPAIHLMVDETHDLTSVSAGSLGTEAVALLEDVASLGNGLEVYTDIYTQHGSLETSVRSELIRGNLHLRVVYRVTEARHGQYVIPEYAKLDASRLEEQGTCYIKRGKDALAEQVRAPKMSHPLMKKIAAQNAAMVTRPPLLLYCGSETAYVAGDGREVTWQEWWDTRWSRLDPAFHTISPQYRAHMATSPAQAFAAMPSPPPPAAAAAPGEGDGKQAAARIMAELGAAHAGLPPGAKPVRVNLGPIMARQKDQFATALESAPPQGISPAQLMEESGMSERWVYGQLRALVDLGILTQPGRGRYVQLPGADLRAAMAEISARNAQLYREARATVSSAA